MKRLKSLFFPKGKKQSSPPVLDQIDPQLRLDLDDSPDEEIYPIDDILLPCAVCGRTFATQSLAKHVRICMQTTPKVRRIFDSSNQRIKGTELAQYSPSNLSQPKSPYMKREQTPPLNKMVNKKAQNTSSAAHTRTIARACSVGLSAQRRAHPHVRLVDQPAQEKWQSKNHIKSSSSPVLLATVENSPCPHCGRNFGARAWDRHIERCAEQSRLKHAPGASSGPANVRMARERLQARTSYKAPLAKSKRAINREKYSLSRSASECSGITEISFDGTRRSSRESIEDIKHLPSIKKLSQSSTKSNGSSINSLSKSRMDDMYDPYLAAENQLKDLISSSSNISKLDMSSIPKLYSSKKSKPKSLQHSPPLKTRDDITLKKDTQNSIFQRSMSLRSPSRNNPVPEITKKHSNPVNKNNSNVNYNLNSILYNSNKAEQQKESPNSKLYPQGNNIDKPKNKLKQNSSRYGDDSLKLSNRTDKNHSAKLKPVEKINRRDDNHNDYSYTGSKIYNEFSGSQESFIDPRLINEDIPLPITVQKFLDNPDLLSSEESLIRENLPTNFGSFTDYVKKERERYSRENSVMSHTFVESREPTTPLIDDLSAQYDKIMVSLEQSMTSNMSLQDEDALYNDLEELMSSMDGDISNDNVYSYKPKSDNHKPANNSGGSNRKNDKYNLSANNNNNSSPKIVPYNKSVSLNFSPLPKKNSPMRSTSLRNSETDNKISPQDNSNKLEEEIMHSLRDIDKYCDGVYDSPHRKDSANTSERNKEKYLNDVYKQETDLKYFMPKNLGLMNESPFIVREKSMSPKNQVSPINKEHPQSMRNKLLVAAENIPCPNCGHCLDIRAWCAEQLRLDSVKRPTQLAQVDFHRPSTLHA